MISSCIVHTLLHIQSFFGKSFLRRQYDRRLEISLTKGPKPLQWAIVPGERVDLIRSRVEEDNSLEMATVTSRREREKPPINNTTRIEVFLSVGRRFSALSFAVSLPRSESWRGKLCLGDWRDQSIFRRLHRSLFRSRTRS